MKRGVYVIGTPINNVIEILMNIIEASQTLQYAGICIQDGKSEEAISYLKITKDRIDQIIESEEEKFSKINNQIWKE